MLKLTVLSVMILAGPQIWSASAELPGVRSMADLDSQAVLH